jgi:hypothetical protein
MPPSAARAVRGMRGRIGDDRDLSRKDGCHLFSSRKDEDGCHLFSFSAKITRNATIPRYGMGFFRITHPNTAPMP